MIKALAVALVVFLVSIAALPVGYTNTPYNPPCLGTPESLCTGINLNVQAPVTSTYPLAWALFRNHSVYSSVINKSDVYRNIMGAVLVSGLAFFLVRQRKSQKLQAGLKPKV